MKNIKSKLTLATTALLGTVVSPATQAAESDQFNIRYSQLHYAETNRISVDKSQIQFTKPLTDTSTFTGGLIFDTMSGATPNGRVFTQDQDTSIIPITTASGNTFTANSNSGLGSQLGLTNFSDDRIALSGALKRQFNRLTALSTGTSLSNEHDYLSIGINSLVTRESPQKLSSVSFGGSINKDKVRPVDGIKEGFGRNWCTTNPALKPAALDCDNDPTVYAPADKFVTAVMLGFTNVINRKTVSQFNLSTSYANGYLSDPYKLVSVLNDSGGNTEEVAIFHEKRPRERLSHSIFWKLVSDFGKRSLHVSNRFFWDDWGILSNSTDLRLHIQLSNRLDFIPHFRFSAQSAADFYRDYFKKTELDTELPEFASADHRLSRQNTTTTGFKFTRRIANTSELSLRGEYIHQSYLTTLMPDMNAIVVQFLFTTYI